MSVGGESRGVSVVSHAARVMSALAHRIWRGVDSRLERVAQMLDVRMKVTGPCGNDADDVELARLQRRDDSIPGLFDDDALGIHVGANGVHQVDFKADPLAGCILAGERRIRFGDGGRPLQRGDILRA